MKTLSKKLASAFTITVKEDNEEGQKKSTSLTSTPEISECGDSLTGLNVNVNVNEATADPAVHRVFSVNDLSAFEAAAEDIRSVLSNKGSISCTDITKLLTRSNEVVDLVRHHFPAAASSSELTDKVKATLDTFDVTPENTLLTQSVCPDEINHEEGDITDLFIKAFGGGKVFHLGGLAGIPFSGKTGFGAFSHHVPDGGHAFILQAPHIGMSDALKFGQYSREGQSCDGAACGAAVGAMGHCASGKPLPNLADASAGSDYQMNFIINEISKCMECIDASFYDSGWDENCRQAMLAKQTHRIGKEMLDNIVSTDFGSDESMLFVLTGIQINMPFDFEDYFEPLTFEARKKDGTVIDLYERTFGRRHA